MVEASVSAAPPPVGTDPVPGGGSDPPAATTPRCPGSQRPRAARRRPRPAGRSTRAPPRSARPRAGRPATSARPGSVSDPYPLHNPLGHHARQRRTEHLHAHPHAVRAPSAPVNRRPAVLAPAAVLVGHHSGEADAVVIIRGIVVPRRSPPVRADRLTSLAGAGSQWRREVCRGVVVPA